MRVLAIAAAGLLASVSPNSAQTSMVPATSADRITPDRQLYDASPVRAPVGHRQPRLSPEIKPAAPKANDPIEDMAREEAMLARRISGICRGC